jgi:hypothetical protein
MSISTDPTSASAPLVQPARRRSRAVAGLVLAALVAVGGVAFAAGRVTAGVGTAGRSFAGFNRNGAGGGAGAAGPVGRGGLGPGQGGLAGASIDIEGTVSAVTGDSLTLTIGNGQTMQLRLAGDTAYYRRDPAAASNIADGDTVQVQIARGAGGRPVAAGSASGATAAAESVTLVSP